MVVCLVCKAVADESIGEEPDIDLFVCHGCARAGYRLTRMVDRRTGQVLYPVLVRPDGAWRRVLHEEGIEC
jgi:hypothetical protein